MCGITGAFAFNGKIEKSWVEDMTSALAHRGPDAQGVATSPLQNCVLGHRRLSILDLSEGANQPMVSSCGRYAMVFNGEIYNFNEIKADIAKIKDIEYQTTSDSEVILEAFALWGKSFVYKLNGMFTIAIYDSESNILWIFRDRLGIKPLYYFRNDKVFAFSSELKSLQTLQDKLGKFSIDKKAVHQFLRLGYIPEPLSIYQEVKKFPSAHYAAITPDGMQETSYWDIRKKIIPKVISDEKEAKKTLKDLLISSVGYRLVSDVPFGTFLSGGIDSSVVTAMAQHVSEQPINTFSIGFKEGKYNEAVFAEKVAKHLKTNHHEFTVSYSDAIEQFDDILQSYDEPYADSSAIPTMLVSKLARQHVTMTLSGDGGDEQFLGYGMYQWAKRLNNPAITTLRKPGSWVFSKMSNKYKRAAEIFRYKDKESIKSHVFSVEQYFFSERELAMVLNDYTPSFFDLEENPKLSRELSPVEAQAFFDLRYYLKDDLLTKVDRASMRYSLETRVPLLDHRIVEFSMNLSENLKWKNGNQKYLLKEVLYDFVPKELFDRPKWGFAIPIRQWLSNEMTDIRKKYLSKSVLDRYGVVNTEAVKEIEKRYLAGEDYLFNKLWAILLLHQWLEKNA